MADSILENSTIHFDLLGQSPPLEAYPILNYLSKNYTENAIRLDIWETVTTILSIVIIIIATLFLARAADEILRKHFPKILLISRVERETDKTFHTILRRLVVAAIYIAGFLMVILQVPQLNRVAIAMLAGAGVAGLAIGFAAQSSLANIISGLFLVIFKPIRIGDYVDFNGEYGHIEDLTLRHTVICTWDLRRIIVPNSSMNDQYIINWSIGSPEVVWPVNFGIAYSSDIDKARSIIIEETKRHPYVMKDKEIIVRLTELGDFAVNLRLTFHAHRREMAFETGCDIREAVKKRFDSEGIEIPYPYQNILLKNLGGEKA